MLHSSAASRVSSEKGNFDELTMEFYLGIGHNSQQLNTQDAPNRQQPELLENQENPKREARERDKSWRGCWSLERAKKVKTKKAPLRSYFKVLL